MVEVVECVSDKVIIQEKYESIYIEKERKNRRVSFI